MAGGRNAYGGSVGIYAPVNGLSGKLYRNWQSPTEQDLFERIRDFVISLRSSMPAAGWDWSELQEFALRQRRISKNDGSDFKDLENIYLEEISLLKEQIQDYRNIIEVLNSSLSEKRRNEDAAESHIDKIKYSIGGEIYSGEIFDRLRLAAKISMHYRDKEGLDSRTIATLSAVIQDLEHSKGLSVFLENLKRSTTDVKNLYHRVSSLLSNHGFDETTTNKHGKMIPRTGMSGLGPITVPLTSSDHRAGKNMHSQIISELGLGKLDF